MYKSFSRVHLRISLEVEILLQDMHMLFPICPFFILHSVIVDPNPLQHLLLKLS